KKTSPEVQTTYEYDSENRPVKITNPSTLNPNPCLYEYAPFGKRVMFCPFGKRIKKTDSTGTRYYLHDEENVLMEFGTDPSGTPINKYTTTSGVDEIISITDKYNNDFWYLYDGLGSVVMLTDKIGDVVQVYNYYAFGKPNVTSWDKNPYKFTAREYDTDSKLYYYRARYYDADTGRFIQKDPLGIEVNGLTKYQPLLVSHPTGKCMSYSFMPGLPSTYYSSQNLQTPQTLNRYAYVLNNPINYTDPFGLITQMLFDLHGLFLTQDSQRWQWRAVSGNSKPDNQWIENTGPIPETGSFNENAGQWLVNSNAILPASGSFGPFKISILPDEVKSKELIKVDGKWKYVTRNYFRIHGGPKLEMPTKGCIRISNKDLCSLISLIKDKGQIPLKVNYDNYRAKGKSKTGYPPVSAIPLIIPFIKVISSKKRNTKNKSAINFVVFFLIILIVQKCNGDTVTKTIGIKKIFKLVDTREAGSGMYPEWSKIDSYIYFHWVEGYQGVKKFTFSRVKINGTDEIEIPIVNSSNLVFTNNGKNIAYIKIISTKTTSPEPISPPEDASFEVKEAYWRKYNKWWDAQKIEYGLFESELDGSNEHIYNKYQKFSLARINSDITLSPNSNEFAFFKETEIYVYDLNTKTIKRVSSPSWKDIPKTIPKDNREL
ncbi:MAG: RHS repeat-associated core domain-containing protein, partial [Elusimicrobiota bacterium]